MIQTPPPVEQCESNKINYMLRKKTSLFMIYHVRNTEITPVGLYDSNSCRAQSFNWQQVQGSIALNSIEIYVLLKTKTNNIAPPSIFVSLPVPPPPTKCLWSLPLCVCGCLLSLPNPNL